FISLVCLAALDDLETWIRANGSASYRVLLWFCADPAPGAGDIARKRARHKTNLLGAGWCHGLLLDLFDDAAIVIFSAIQMVVLRTVTRDSTESGQSAAARRVPAADD